MEFVDIVQGIHPLPPDELDKLNGIIEYIHIPKNTALVHANRTSKYIYFLKTGICRIYYNKEHKEIILDFSFPGDVIVSLNSYIYQNEGYETIESTEACGLYRIAIYDLQQLYKTSLDIANWGRKLAEKETLKIEKRLMQQLFKTASERYADLLNKEPNLLHKIKLGYIASYLGVSQVTLSRIRADVR